MSDTPPRSRRYRPPRTKRGMDREIEHLFSAAKGWGWVYDDHADLWIVRDKKHTGPGRGFLLIERGLRWRSVVIPDEAVS